MKTLSNEARETVQQLLREINGVQRDLDAAPSRKVGSEWWNDRISALELYWQKVERIRGYR